jgi:hypothetical protein
MKKKQSRKAGLDNKNLPARLSRLSILNSIKISNDISTKINVLI